MSTSWQQFKDDWLADPEHRRLYEEAKARQDRSIHRPCRMGNCTEFYDPVERTVIGGWGPVGCPCENSRTFKRKGQPQRRVKK